MAGDIRVLIADDHAVVRQGLRLFLGVQDGIKVVGEATNGVEAVEQVERLHPDVVLMDLEMPELDGIAATKLVKERAPDTKVVVLTSFSDDDRLFPALAAGAAGYLMKDVSPEHLVQAIATVHQGLPLLDREVTRRLLERVSSSRHGPEGTVTILYTDLQSSTQMNQTLGDERARAVMREHDSIIRTALHEHDGVEVKHTGDGMMSAFSSARRAVACAVAIQRALTERNARGPNEAALHVRMGLNTGEVIAEEHDYFGESVILAARVMAQAAGGQIFVSEITRALAATDVVRFDDLGPRALKGFDEPRRLFAVRWDGAT